MKDNFSKVANLYSLFRPSYPAELFSFLIPLVPSHKTAWDVGTGNGQIAGALANYFEKVVATDFSEKQLKNAVVKQNIIYKQEKAEHSSFPDQSFDLITVAQAIHWFDFTKFYAEVNRTLKPVGILAVIGYDICKIDTQTDKTIHHLYSDILKSYWDPERKYIDAHYKNIPFPFEEIPASEFSISYNWNLEQLLGFLNSWSAVQHYKDRNNNENPLDQVADELKSNWNAGQKKQVTFPVFVRAGRKSR
jgi:ubiquinone/menaquinone biosynthesis C-methylase UbiE